MNVAPHRPSDPRLNQLLAALSAADLVRWLPHLEPVQWRQGQVLWEASDAPAHAYFPTTAVVSLMSLTLDGESAEFGVVGNDGMVGISLFTGGNATPSRAVVQHAGQAYRLRAQVLRDEVNQAGPVLQILLRYTQSLIAQVSQTAMCNRYHSIDQQLCRRLLLGLDRVPSAQLPMTQELVAGLLGVRREGITAAALKLQRAGVIRYSRGQIVVLDRRRLEQGSCECYAVARKEHLRLLPQARPHSQPQPQPQLQAQAA